MKFSIFFTISLLTSGIAGSPLFLPSNLKLGSSESSPFALRNRAVKLDKNILGSEAVSVDGIAKSLQLNLFQDVHFVAIRTRVNWLGPNRFDWVGKIGSDDAIISIRNGFVHGTFQHQNRVFEIESIDDSNQKITEVNVDAFNRLEKLQPTDVEGPQIPIEESKITPGQPDPVIDVMVVYLKEASSKITNMETFLASLFTLSNQAYVNSGIPQTIRLVHSQEVVSGIVGRKNLDWLRNDTGIAKLRDKYGADLVTMILETHDAAGTANGYYSIVTRTAAFGNKTFPHELGHNMGAQHAWEQFTSHDGFAYGYINHEKSWRTIMSYSACNNGGSCTRINWFSNPEIKYEGLPTGIADSRDNARMMRSRSVTISNLKPTKVVVSLTHSGKMIEDKPSYFGIGGVSKSSLIINVRHEQKLRISAISIDGMEQVIANQVFQSGKHEVYLTQQAKKRGIKILQVQDSNGQLFHKTFVIQ